MKHRTLFPMDLEAFCEVFGDVDVTGTATCLSPVW
jgi:hypothetical protein